MLLLEASPELARARDLATHEAWGGPLPAAAYQALEGRLRGRPWPRACLRTWLLCDEAGAVLSSCETYRMPSHAAVPGFSYAVASVYTEPALRRRGYVTALLERLAERLAQEEAGAHALALYSDVPLEVYRRAGFEPRPALDLVFESLPGDPAAGVDALLRDDQAASALAVMPAPQGPFAIHPVPDQIDWHLERERIFATVLARPRPAACGARLGAAAALWAADFRTGRMLVLLLHAPGGEAAALLTSARRTAHAAGLAHTVLWQTPQDPAIPGSRTEDRAPRLDSVPMLRPLAPGIRAADWNWVPRVLWV